MIDTFINTQENQATEKSEAEQLSSYATVYGEKKILKREIHGQLQCYRAGCSCKLCKAANTEHSRRTREKYTTEPEKIPHGTDSGYTNWGCRCEECSAARALATKQYQKRVQLKAILDPDSIKHGTFFAYAMQKCKCDICMEHMREYSRKRKLKGAEDGT